MEYLIGAGMAVLAMAIITYFIIDGKNHEIRRLEEIVDNNKKELVQLLDMPIVTHHLAFFPRNNSLFKRIDVKDVSEALADTIDYYRRRQSNSPQALNAVEVALELASRKIMEAQQKLEEKPKTEE